MVDTACEDACLPDQPEDGLQMTLTHVPTLKPVLLSTHVANDLEFPCRVARFRPGIRRAANQVYLDPIEFTVLLWFIEAAELHRVHAHP